MEGLLPVQVLRAIPTRSARVLLSLSPPAPRPSQQLDGLAFTPSVKYCAAGAAPPSPPSNNALHVLWTPECGGTPADPPKPQTLKPKPQTQDILCTRRILYESLCFL